MNDQAANNHALHDVAGTPIAGRWDWNALLSGASVALVFAIPLTVIAAIIDSDDGGAKALFFFGAMLGFVLGAGCAAWIQQAGTPLSHGIVTASGTYLAAQAAFVLVRLIGGNTVNWFSVFFTLTLVVAAGLLGGILGNRLQRRGIVPSAQRIPAVQREDGDIQ